MNDSHHRADGEGKFVAKCDVNKNAKKREDRRNDRGFANGFAHRRADTVLMERAEAAGWEAFDNVDYVRTVFVGGVNAKGRASGCEIRLILNQRILNARAGER